MAAPSKPFTPISDVQIDANSPTDELLMTSIRDALVHLEEWLGLDFTAAQNHRHNDIDSTKINQADLVRVDTVSIFDDFISLADWKLTGANAVIVDGENGVVDFVASAAGVYDGIRTLKKLFKLNGNQINFEIRIKDATLPADTYVLGLVNTDGADPGDGIYIDKDVGGNWKSVTVNASTTTINIWDVAPGTSYTTLRIEATPTSVEFFADGVSKAVHTTNIPGTSTLLAVAAWVRMSAVVPRTFSVDYIDVVMNNRF